MHGTTRDKFRYEDELTSQAIVGSRADRTSGSGTSSGTTRRGPALHLGPQAVVGGGIGRHTGLTTTAGAAGPTGHLGAQPLVGGAIAGSRGGHLLRRRQRRRPGYGEGSED